MAHQTAPLINIHIPKDKQHYAKKPKDFMLQFWPDEPKPGRIAKPSERLTPEQTADLFEAMLMGGGRAAESPAD
jgi:hypothetical protein